MWRWQSRKYDTSEVSARAFIKPEFIPEMWPKSESFYLYFANSFIDKFETNTKKSASIYIYNPNRNLTKFSKL